MVLSDDDLVLIEILLHEQYEYIHELKLELVKIDKKLQAAKDSVRMKTLASKFGVSYTTMYREVQAMDIPKHRDLDTRVRVSYY